MMNGSDDDVDLGLRLGFSNSCMTTKLNNNSGAGVNAEPGFDMSFAASDPLSELVWSPHKGLSLRCADCSKADKKPFLLWNVGPSNMVPSSSQSIRFWETDEEKIVDGNLILSHATFHGAGEAARGASLYDSTSNSAGPGIKTSHAQDREGSYKSEERNVDESTFCKNSTPNEGRIVDNNEKEVSNPQVARLAAITDGEKNIGQLNQNPSAQENRNSSHDLAISKSLCGNMKEFSANFDDTTKGVACKSQNLAGDVTASEVHGEMQSRAHTDLLSDSPLKEKMSNKAVLATEEGNKKMINMCSYKLPSLGEIECTDENDVHELNSKEAYWQSEGRLLRGNSAPLVTSEEKGYQRKGNSRALSDGYFSGKFSNGEDDSHESVESCNSAGLLSKGKRWLNYEENMAFESKRLKQNDGTPASMSVARKDSSFMNWIYNMVKGFSRSNEEEDPSLPHALTPANIVQENSKCSEHHDFVSQSMGFQAMFQSLYAQNTELIGARVSKDDCSFEESRGIDKTDKTNIVSSPISCPRQNGVSCENIMSNGKIIPSGTDRGVHSGQHYLPCTTIPVQLDSAAELAETRASINLQVVGDKHGINSSEALEMQVRTKVENENPDLASEGGPVNNMSDKSNLPGNLWVTRFSSKTSSSILNLDQSKQISSCCEAKEYTNYKAVSSHIQKNPDFSLKQKLSDARNSSNETSGDVLAKEVQAVAPNTECSVGFKESHGHNQQNSVLKLDAILPSQTLKRSEAVASEFARRLDVLRHIIPLDSENGATCAAVTCFYCGKSGHSLADCSEVTETELNNILRNISSYVGAECPRLCIRCFQLDHWAAACPRGSSSRQQCVEQSTFFCVGNLKLVPSEEITSQFLEKEEHNKGAICGRAKSCTNTGFRNQVTTDDSLGQGSSSSRQTHKRSASDSREKSSVLPNLQLSNLASTHVSSILQGLFNAVRRLQLSRTDILKLMKFQVFVPHLEGFFLRLRLGKWEAGLGGTGYHVACITGQAGEAVNDSKRLISVTIGGIKCQVESQYVSNQDFLEEEFMAWWCRTLRSGRKLPTKDDLESKYKQRINLGF